MKQPPSVAPTTCALLALTTLATAAPDRSLSRFVDDRTPAILYVDVNAIDLDQTWPAMVRVLKQAYPNPDDLKKQAGSLGMIVTVAKQWAASFKAAGGKDLYLLPASNPYARDPRPATYLIPLAAGTNADSLAPLFNTLSALGSPATQPATTSHTVIDNVLVISTQPNLDRLAAPPTPSPAQDPLLDSLLRNSRASIRFVSRPADLQANPIVLQAAPSLQASKDLPFSAPEWKSVRSIAVDLVTPKAGESATITFHCADAPAADQLAKLLKSRAADLAAGKDVGTIGPANAARLAKITAPRTAGPDVLLPVRQDALEQVLVPLLLGKDAADLKPSPTTTPTSPRHTPGAGPKPFFERHRI